MRKIVDCSEWAAHMIKLIKHHEERTHYNMGYIDAVDQVDDWFCGQPYFEEYVRHGKWQKAKYIEAPVYICSECGNREPLPRKFCPECGLMMEAC